LYIATCTSLLVHRDLYIQEYQYYSVPSVVPTDIRTIRPQNRTHLKQTTAVVGVIVNLRMVTTVVTSATQALVRVLLDLSHNKGQLVFLTKDKTHDVSLLEKAGSTVAEYFEWDLPKVLSQGGADLLKYADNRRFSSEPDVVESNREADS
jgi:hypothetical protein